MNRSPEPLDFRSFQVAFAARIRDPDSQPQPQGVPVQRMRVYEDLLFNNIEGFLQACFPVTRELLGDHAWRNTARRFFAEHHCGSPLFRDIPGEFLAWMETQAESLFPDHPYLYALMHYEWLELSVSISPGEASACGIDPDGDLLSGQPILNPTAQLTCYSYPVHRIGPRFRLAELDTLEGQVFWYLLYRDHEEVVRFIVLNPVSARLLELLRDSASTGEQAMLQIARELDHPDPAFIREMGQTLLVELRRAGAVSGIWRKS